MTEHELYGELAKEIMKRLTHNAKIEFSKESSCIKIEITLIEEASKEEKEE